MRSGLAHDACSVSVNGFHADSQGGGNFFIGLADNHQIEHLPLAIGQRLESDTFFKQRGEPTTDNPPTFENPGDGIGDFAHGVGFAEYPVGTNFNQLSDFPARFDASEDHDLAIGRPAAGFQKDFGPACVRHGHVEHEEIGTVLSDCSDGVDTVFNLVDDCHPIAGKGILVGKRGGNGGSNDRVIICYDSSVGLPNPHTAKPLSSALATPIHVNMKGNRGSIRDYWRRVMDACLFRYARTAFPFALRLLLIFAFIPTAAWAAASDPVVLEPGRSFERLEGHAVYLTQDSGSDLDLEDALAAYLAGQFEETFSSESEASAFERGLWIAIEMNYRETSGTSPFRGVIGLGGIFVVHPEVFVVRNGGAPEEILASKAGTGRVLEPRYFTYVRTASLEVEPGDRITVLIHTSRADRPTIGFFREGELGSNQVVATIIKAGFTFIPLFIGVTLAIISIATGRTIGLLIAGAYSLVMIQNDTSLFTTNFIESPWLARQVWEGVTLISTFFLYYGFIFSFREELHLEKSRLYTLLAWLLPLPLIWIAYVSDSTADILWAYYLSLFLFACTITFKFDIAPRLRVLAGMFVVGASLGAVVTDPVYLGATLPDLTLEFIRDLLRTMGAVGLLILLLVDVIRSRRERVEAAQERIAALETQAETDRRLLQTEREYARAREAAARRKAQLAAASHDIRQPIVGLRSALATEADSLSPSLSKQLGEAIDYLENLTEEYSDREKPVIGSETFEKEEAYSLDLITRAVGDMFGAEAAKAGVEFKIRGGDHKTQVPALALIRTTSNLVANALRHSHARTIRLEVRQADHCQIVVSDDGVGMDAAVLAKLQQPGVKGNESDGDGLGLAIVHDLAKRYGFSFEIHSEPGKGTEAVIGLPD